MKIRNNEEWKSDNENNETGNNITIKSEELDPIATTTTFTGTINLKVSRPPATKGSTIRKLLKLKHNQSTKDHLNTRSD
jgi:hypothetical protein